MPKRAAKHIRLHGKGLPWPELPVLGRKVFPNFQVDCERFKQSLRLVAEIGKGSYGTVFRAEDESTTAPVAVKISTCEAGDCNGKELFLLSHVQEHGHVVRLHDGACSPYFLVIVMEIGAMSLSQYLSKPGVGFFSACGGVVPPLLAGGIVPSSFAVTLGGQVASALEHVHSVDIIHLDLYSKNIVFRRDGTAMVIDFGMSVHVADGQDCDI